MIYTGMRAEHRMMIGSQELRVTAAPFLLLCRSLKEAKGGEDKAIEIEDRG